MSALGLAMFAVALVAIVATGWPVWAVLLGTGAAFAAVGVALGAFGWTLLGALPGRVVGLLEHDLLQALPLFAFIGALLDRLPLAGHLHGAGERVFARSAAAPQLSALLAGALLAPMNGSVGASLHTFARRVAPVLRGRGVGRAETAATVCTASTLGVVIPPSLVLLLLGDAMMRAHTEALNATHASARIVNTQDVVHASLVPGALVLASALAIAWWRGRGRAPTPAPRLSTAALAEAAVAALAVLVLLAGVATGRLYAVEAAATGAVALVAWAVVSRRLDRATFEAVLVDAMVLTGVLMALLVAATGFSLVLRAFGSDALVADGLGALAGSPRAMLAAVLGGLVACSFVLDAFELIFLVVPVVMPPLLAAVPDAAWVAALTLLVLQAGFLLPPLGYAVVMSRRVLADPPPLADLARALVPQLVAIGLVVAATVAWPRLAHPLGSPSAEALVPPPALDETEVERLMRSSGGRSGDATR